MKKLVLVWLFTLILLFNANAGTPTYKVEEQNFKEFLYSEMPISSSKIIHGLQFGDLAYRPKKMKLLLGGIQPEDHFLCLRFGDLSGLYRAEAVFPNNDFPSQIVVELPGERFKDLSATAGEIGTLAFASQHDSCANPVAYYSVSWTIADYPSGSSFHAMINMSQNALGRIVNYSDGSEAPCITYTGGDSASNTVVQRFSHLCSFFDKDVPLTGASLNVIIETFSARDSSGRIELRAFNSRPELRESKP